MFTELISGFFSGFSSKELRTDSTFLSREPHGLRLWVGTQPVWRGGEEQPLDGRSRSP